MRAADGSGELAIASYELLCDTEILGRMAMEKIPAGLSTRRYPAGVEPVGRKTDESPLPQPSLPFRGSLW